MLAIPHPRHHVGAAWQRLQMNTDLIAWMSHGWIKFRNAILGSHFIFLGREGNWLKAPLRLASWRRDGHYFAAAQKSKEGP